MLKAFLNYISRLALAFWLGQMLFFAFVIAPNVFRVLERSDAAKLQNVIFGAYYPIGMACAFVILASQLVQFISGGVFRRAERIRSGKPELKRYATLGLVLVSGLLFAFSHLYLFETMKELQPLVMGVDVPDATAKSLFDNLHQASTAVNGIVLLFLLILLMLL